MNCTQAQHEGTIVLLDRRAEIDRRFARRDRAVGQILAGAEAAPCARQQQHAERRIGFDRLQGIADFRVHRGGEAVEPIRAVERDTRDTACRFELDVFVTHGPLFRKGPFNP